VLRGALGVEQVDRRLEGVFRVGEPPGNTRLEIAVSTADTDWLSVRLYFVIAVVANTMMPSRVSARPATVSFRRVANAFIPLNPVVPALPLPSIRITTSSGTITWAGAGAAQANAAPISPAKARNRRRCDDVVSPKRAEQRGHITDGVMIAGLLQPAE
jgi:hypothetical protein